LIEIGQIFSLQKARVAHAQVDHDEGKFDRVLDKEALQSNEPTAFLTNPTANSLVVVAFNYQRFLLD
jgi:hypothetical protein